MKLVNPLSVSLFIFILKKNDECTGAIAPILWPRLRPRVFRSPGATTAIRRPSIVSPSVASLSSTVVPLSLSRSIKCPIGRAKPRLSGPSMASAGHYRPPVALCHLSLPSSLSSSLSLSFPLPLPVCRFPRSNHSDLSSGWLGTS